MMNFRQRMGWVGVAFYLLLSVMAAYYIFEVHSFSLERVQRAGTSPSAPPPAITVHGSLLPVWMWALIFLLPYLQLFLFLFSCTRADPRAVGYCVLPVCIALLYSRRHAAKLANHRAAGSLIDTQGTTNQRASHVMRGGMTAGLVCDVISCVPFKHSYRFCPDCGLTGSSAALSTDSQHPVKKPLPPVATSLFPSFF